MGEGLKNLFDEIHSSNDAEGEEDLGEVSGSDSGDESEDSCSPASPRLDAEVLIYDFSSLVDQLPLKKGLSKYYQGKSQSFTSLSGVKSLEDLPKKEKAEVPLTRNLLKPCRSYAGLEQAQMAVFPSPETCRNSTATAASCTPFMARSSSNNNSSNGSFLARRARPPPAPLHKRR